MNCFNVAKKPRASSIGLAMMMWAALSQEGLAGEGPPDGSAMGQLLFAAQGVVPVPLLAPEARAVLGRSGANEPDMFGRTALHRAVIVGDAGLVSSLLTRPDIQVNAQDNEGWTALMEAANLGRTEIARLLIKSGANAKITSKQDRTALTLALTRGNVDIVLLLDDSVCRSQVE